MVIDDNCKSVLDALQFVLVKVRHTSDMRIAVIAQVVSPTVGHIWYNVSLKSIFIDYSLSKLVLLELLQIHVNTLG